MVAYFSHRTGWSFTPNRFTQVGGSSSKFRLVSYQGRRMRRTLSLHESQDGFAAAVRSGSSEESHRRCPWGESFRLPRSSASLPRRAVRGCAEGAPRAFVPWLAVHAGDPCNRGVHSSRRVRGKVFLLLHSDPMRLHGTGR